MYLYICMYMWVNNRTKREACGVPRCGAEFWERWSDMRGWLLSLACLAGRYDRLQSSYCALVLIYIINCLEPCLFTIYGPTLSLISRRVLFKLALFDGCILCTFTAWDRQH